MKALILIAGKSARMGNMTEGIHKTLLDVGGRPILEWMLRSLIAGKIHDVIFICGYMKDLIRSWVEDNFPMLNTTWIENPEYATTNTAYSVWLAGEKVLAADVDILLINGDVVFDSRVIRTIIDAPGMNVLAVRFDRVAEEEVKVRLNERRQIIEIGKHIPPSEAAGESVGVNRLSRLHLPKLFEVLGERIENGEGAGEYYEAAFNQLVQEGMLFLTADVTDLPVMEVDTSEDYQEVLNTIFPRLRA